MNKTQLDKTLGTIKNYVNTTKMNYLKYTSNVDVNTLKTTGIYSLPSNCTNNGTTNSGTLIVDFNVGTPYQLWIPDNTHSLYKRNWDKTNSKWNGWANTYTGNVTGSSSSCTGNAASATKLATARNISLTGDTTGSVSFDGSANVSFETKTRQVAFVGSDTDGTAGWYKVAEQTCSGYGDTNITFMVTSTYANYNFGILQLQIRSDDSSIACTSLGWIARKGLDKSHYIVVISGMKWTLYAYQPNPRYGRLAFEILSQSSINGKSMTWTLKFANNGTKESKTPTASVTSSDVATVNSANSLTTARTLTIGNKGKTFNGSANVSWTLDEIGAAPKSHGTHVSYGGNGSATTVSRSDHTHSYLPLSGGTLSGKVSDSRITTGNTQLFNATASQIYIGNPGTPLTLESSNNPTVNKAGATYTLYHTGNKPKPADIGAATSGHTHKSLELSGNNTISLTDDTTTKWGAQKNSIHYYSTTGKLTDQPGQYGILCNFTNGDKEVHQLWLTQSNGNILHRGGNAEGWNTVSWLTLLDSANYSNYAFPKTGGTLTGKITFQDQLGGGGLSSLINCNALHKGTGNGQMITASDNHIYVGNPNTPITIEGNTHPKVNVNGTEYTMYHTGNKPSAADIGAAASSHIHNTITTKGTNTINGTANDTTANWGAQGHSVHWYTAAGLLKDQPSQWGYILNIGSGTEVHQLWMTQASGNLAHRGGNGSGWSGTWRTILDSSNFSSYALPLSGGTLTGATTFNNYLKLNAWSGYGTGTANFWYDGNNKTVEIGTANSLKVNGKRAVVMENYDYNYKIRGGSGLSGADGFITFSW